MTVKEEFAAMVQELYGWNKKEGWSDTQFVYQIEHHSKKSKTMFNKILNERLYITELHYEHHIITSGQYIERMKILRDCERSIERMEIF